MIEAEATEKIGAGRYQRTKGRTTQRNGHRPKTVSTTSGDVEVQIPKLRSGSFFPSLFERRRRIDKALHAVIMEAYVHGVSTRNVDDLVAALGVDSGISKSEVSRICGQLDSEIARFRERTLTHTTFPYIFLDATFCKVQGRRLRGLARDGRGDRRLDQHPPAKSWVPRSVTVSRSSFGVSSLPASKPAACLGCIWSSPMPTKV